MRSVVILSLMAGLALGCTQLRAQEPVVGVADPDALFHSSDPTINANLQATYHIYTDLLEANHWELANRYLTDRYIQHNPNAASGLAGVVYFFTKVRKVKPKPISEKMQTKIVSVLAQGDFVVVATPREYWDPKSKHCYFTTWFDMWRFVGGKADEHWDTDTRQRPPSCPAKRR
ncbi:MAG: nuclear transport factor 2 family protein [Steroidobacteraceae bacterium]